MAARHFLPVMLVAAGALASAGQEPRVFTPPPVSGERTTPRETPPKAAAEFRKSQEAFQDNRIEKAIRHLRAGIALDPDNTDAYNDLGVIYYNTNAVDKALEAFTAMVTIDPHSYRGHLNLAFTLLAQRRYRDAENAARRAVDLNKMDPRARYLLGIALAFQRKNLDEAQENLAAAAPDIVEARLELSRLLMEKGDLERAMQELELFTKERRRAGNLQLLGR